MTDRDTPLRLAEAAAIAYPNGSMTVSGLRREAKRGRLVIEQVAGKDYTTLNAIDEMRALCRVQPKARDCGSGNAPAAPPSGSSETGTIKKAQAALSVTLQGLKKPSNPTSPASTRPARGKASVIHLQSRLPTC